VLSPYGLDIIENCQTCQMRPERLFCDLSIEALQAFEAIKCVTAYPKGAVLFVEGQMPSGIFVLCQGTVKMSVCDRYGKKLIVKITKAGEVLGLSATVSGQPYELSAETVEPCQVNFLKRHHFLHFLKQHPDACFKVAEQLSEKYSMACDGVRSLGSSRAAAQRLAKLLLDWSGRDCEPGKSEHVLELTLTQEEIGQLLGTTRETVIRTIADLKKRRIVEGKGSTLAILDRPALVEIARLQNKTAN
jgi:CRP/FNR family transcriptional regulator, cyclic AMP receptor protein